jgi:hypothetical protein
MACIIAHEAGGPCTGRYMSSELAQCAHLAPRAIRSASLHSWRFFCWLTVTTKVSNGRCCSWLCRLCSIGPVYCRTTAGSLLTAPRADSTIVTACSGAGGLLATMAGAIAQVGCTNALHSKRLISWRLMATSW